MRHSVISIVKSGAKPVGILMGISVLTCTCNTAIGEKCGIECNRKNCEEPASDDEYEREQSA